jgi:glycosyltransferase involved in cell wall biosynthesis
MESRKTKVWFPLIRAGTGTDVFTRRLAEALVRRGVKTEISSFPLGYEPIPFLLRKVTPPAGTDIVFANSWNGFAFRRVGLPLVVTVHHGGFDPSIKLHRSPAQNLYHQYLIRQFELRSLYASDAITAVSNYVGASLRRHTPTLNAIETIHNWVDIDRFRPARRTRDGRRVFRLLFVGKLSPLKGADLLPKIMRLLGEDFELCIAGGLPGQFGNMSDNVRLLGWLNEDELIRAYQESDALLFPSRSEGFGYAALEAMACGKPVIASDSTALPEVVSNGITGLLCNPGDAEAFADACRQLAASPRQRSEMAEAGRQKAVEKFSEAAVVPRYLALIDRLAGG